MNNAKEQNTFKKSGSSENLKGKAIINGRETDILIPYSEIERFFEWREEKQIPLKGNEFVKRLPKKEVDRFFEQIFREESKHDSLNKFNKDNSIVRKAVEIALEYGGFSTSMIQAKLGKGHGFVSALALWLEENEVIGAINNHYPRKMLISSMEEFDKKFEK